ncbi:MAG: hypothetical protein NT039_00815 [Candidatus Berkelbacteria bacterium]|nr:hypothetical protein [Candidatus Berkelbacteria bacterium]
MFYQILKFITPKTQAQQSIMGEFRDLVCPKIISTSPDCQGKTGKESLTCCLTHINLNDTIVLVNVVVRIAFGLAGVIALIYLIYAGYLFMTSLGNPDSVAKAKTKLLLAVTGLIIIILAYAFVAFLLNIFGAPGATMNNPIPS